MSADDDARRIRGLVERIDELAERVSFLEKIVVEPHNNSKRCRVAEQFGAGCCNRECDGHWGTGCWCCHSLKFAADADAGTIAKYLALYESVTNPKG